MKATHKFFFGLFLILGTIWAWEAFDLEGYWIIPAAILLSIGFYFAAFHFGAVINLFKKK